MGLVGVVALCSWWAALPRCFGGGGKKEKEKGRTDMNIQRREGSRFSVDSRIISQAVNMAINCF